MPKKRRRPAPHFDRTSEEEYLILDDVFTGIAMLGAPGSGKTSALDALAQILLVRDDG